jgi:shikimate kinase
MNNIILIGFMCSGKTTVAPLLAKKLLKEVVEIDDLVRKTAKKTTEEIFSQYGEVGYREFEIAVAKSLRNKNNVIISTGGGSVMNKIIIDYLKNTDNKIVFLDTPFELLKKRLDPKIPRPLFNDLNVAKKLYELRLPLYNAYADIKIQTQNKTPKKITEEIIKKITL